MHGMHGTLEAELEVKRSELTAFLCVSSRQLSVVPTCQNIMDGIMFCAVKHCGSRFDFEQDLSAVPP